VRGLGRSSDRAQVKLDLTQGLGRRSIRRGVVVSSSLVRKTNQHVKYAKQMTAHNVSRQSSKPAILLPLCDESKLTAPKVKAELKIRMDGGSARTRHSNDSCLVAYTRSCHAFSYRQAGNYNSPVSALNPKAKVGSFESAHLRRNLDTQQVPFTKRLLLRLGFSPCATEFESRRLVYGYCRLHGYYVDYPHGLDERYILCPKCLESARCDMQV
jgi:hypothetical protein